MKEHIHKYHLYLNYSYIREQLNIFTFINMMLALTLNVIEGKATNRYLENCKKENGNY